MQRFLMHMALAHCPISPTPLLPLLPLPRPPPPHLFPQVAGKKEDVEWDFKEALIGGAAIDAT